MSSNVKSMTQLSGEDWEQNNKNKKNFHRIPKLIIKNQKFFSETKVISEEYILGTTCSGNDICKYK